MTRKHPSAMLFVIAPFRSAFSVCMHVMHHVGRGRIATPFDRARHRGAIIGLIVLTVFVPASRGQQGGFADWPDRVYQAERRVVSYRLHLPASDTVPARAQLLFDPSDSTSAFALYVAKLPIHHVHWLYGDEPPADTVRVSREDSSLSAPGDTLRFSQIPSGVVGLEVGFEPAVERFLADTSGGLHLTTSIQHGRPAFPFPVRIDHQLRVHVHLPMDRTQAWLLGREGIDTLLTRNEYVVDLGPNVAPPSVHLAYTTGSALTVHDSLSLSGESVRFSTSLPGNRPSHWQTVIPAIVKRTLYQTARLVPHAPTAPSLQVIVWDVDVPIVRGPYLVVPAAWFWYARSTEDFAHADQLLEQTTRLWLSNALSARDWASSWISSSFASFAPGLYRLAFERDTVAYYVHLSGLKTTYLSEGRSDFRPLDLLQWRTGADLDDAQARAKGAWVHHMLRVRLGTEAYLNAIEDFVGSSRGDMVESVQFLERLNLYADSPLDAFFDQWVYEAGHPIVQASIAHDASASTVTVRIEQTQEGYMIPPVFDFPVTIAAQSLFESSEVVQLFDARSIEASLPAAIRPRYVLVDGMQEVLMELTVDQPLIAWAAQARYATMAPAQLQAIEQFSGALDDPALVIALRQAWQQASRDDIRARLVAAAIRLSPSADAANLLSEWFERANVDSQQSIIDRIATYPQGPTRAALLAKALQQPDPRVIARAVYHLLPEQVDSQLWESALISESPGDVIRRTAIALFTEQQLSYLTETDIERTIRLMSRPGVAVDIRTRMIALLGPYQAQRSAVRASLLSYSQDPDPRIRAAAVAVMMRSEDRTIRSRVAAMRETESDVLVRLALDQEDLETAR